MSEKKDKISIGIAGKRPHLHAALNNAETTKETLQLIGLFMDLADEALDPEKGIRWVDLPGKFHKDLTFPDLLRGIIKGCLDVREINEENFDTLGADLHPLAMFTHKEITSSGGVKVNYNKWREHFQMEGKPNEESITMIIRNLMRYGRYVNFKLIFDNLKTDWQVNSLYRGLGAEHVKRLPFYPALKYQEKLYGELGGVGKMFDEIGSFDCGDLSNYEGDETCPACKVGRLWNIVGFHVCDMCNAGFKNV